MRPAAFEAGLYNLFARDKAACGRITPGIGHLQQMGHAHIWLDSRILEYYNNGFDLRHHTAYLALGRSSITAVQQQLQGHQGTHLLNRLARWKPKPLRSKQLGMQFSAAVISRMQQGGPLLIKAEKIFAVMELDGKMKQCDIESPLLKKLGQWHQEESEQLRTQALVVLLMALMRSALPLIVDINSIADLELMQIQEETLAAESSTSSLYMGVDAVVNKMGGIGM